MTRRCHKLPSDSSYISNQAQLSTSEDSEYDRDYVRLPSQIAVSELLHEVRPQVEQPNQLLIFLAVRVFGTNAMEKDVPVSMVNTLVQIDDGSSLNLINSSLAKALGATLNTEGNMRITGIGGSVMGTQSCIVYLQFESISGQKVAIRGQFILTDSLISVPLLIGAQTINGCRIRPNDRDIDAVEGRVCRIGRGSQAIQVAHEAWSNVKLRLRASESSTFYDDILQRVIYYSMEPYGDLVHTGLVALDHDHTQSINKSSPATAAGEEHIMLAAVKSLQDNTKILDDLLAPQDDDVEELEEYCSLGTDETGRPDKFPIQYWCKVFNDQRPHVQDRWDKYTSERLEEILREIEQIDINLERPNQKVFVFAQVLANLDCYFIQHEDIPTPLKGFTYRIHTTTEEPQVARRQVQWSFLQKAYMNVKMKQLMKANRVGHSLSAWRSNVMLVEYPERVKTFMERHKDDVQAALDDPANEKEIGTFYRCTIDLTPLNKVTVPDVHPMPNVLDIIDQFQGCRHFNCADACDAFWLCALDERDRFKTAFQTPDRLMEWNVMPQGHKNSAVFWNRVIQAVFRDSPKSILTYQDDLFCVHFFFLMTMLGLQEKYNRLRSYNITLKHTKSKMNYDKLRILGHVITTTGRTPDPKKVQAIVDLDYPKTPSEAKSFLGMVGYHRQYIHRMADLCAPIFDVSAPDADIVGDWDDNVHGRAIREIKHQLSTAPMLMLPDMSKPFRIEVDTCLVNGRGIGAILLQRDPTRGEYDYTSSSTSQDGWKPVAYFSKKLTDSERKYGVTEAEAKGLHDAIMHWSVYLRTGVEFQVVVDHSALAYLVNSPATTANRRLLRYCLNLSAFRFSVVYKKGEHHECADAISRMFRYEDRCEPDTDEPIMKSYGVVDDETIRLIRDTNRSALDQLKSFLQRHVTTDTSDVILQLEALCATYDKFVEDKFIDSQQQEYTCNSVTASKMTESETSLARRMMNDIDYITSLHPSSYSMQDDYYLVTEDDSEDHWDIFPMGTEIQDIELIHLGDSDRSHATHIRIVHHCTGLTQLFALPDSPIVHTQDSVFMVHMAKLTRNRKARVITDLGQLRSNNASRLKRRARPTESLNETAASLPTRSSRARSADPPVKKRAYKSRRRTVPEAEPVADDQRQQILQAVMDARAAKLRRRQDKEDEVRRLTALRQEKRLQREADKAKEQIRISEARAAKQELVQLREQERSEQLQAKRMEQYRNRIVVYQQVNNILGPIDTLEVVPWDPSANRPLQPDQYEVYIEGLTQAESKTSLIGAPFIDPVSQRLFEIAYIYYDMTHKCLAILRRPLDGELPTQEDAKAYRLEGLNNVEQHVQDYATRASILDLSVSWPQTEDDMRAYQLSDPELAPIILSLENNSEEPLSEDYQSNVVSYTMKCENDTVGCVLRGIYLHRKTLPSIDTPIEFSIPVTIIPQALKLIVLRLFHDAIGHPGSERMRLSISIKYYWKTLDADVMSYCNNCHKCLRRKVSHHGGTPPIQRYPMSRRPFDRVHIDLIGPLSHNESQPYTYALVAKEPITQWIEVVPLVDKTAESVQHAILMHIVNVHGSPRVIITDNGTEFVNNLAAAINSLINVHHHTTIPYHPAANGLVENFNRTLKDMLSTFIAENQHDWPKWIPIVVHSYRTTVSPLTGYSPFRAVFGREARQTTDHWIKEFASRQNFNIDDYVSRLTEIMLSTWTRAGDRIEANHRKRDAHTVTSDTPRIKRERYFRPYNVGDRFMLESIPKRYIIQTTSAEKVRLKINAKLQPRYTGPFLITEVLNPTTYLANVDGEEQRVHAQRMKRVDFGPQDYLPMLLRNEEHTQSGVSDSDQEEPDLVRLDDCYYEQCPTTALPEGDNTNDESEDIANDESEDIESDHSHEDSSSYPHTD